MKILLPFANPQIADTTKIPLYFHIDINTLNKFTAFEMPERSHAAVDKIPVFESFNGIARRTDTKRRHLGDPRPAWRNRPRKFVFPRATPAPRERRRVNAGRECRMSGMQDARAGPATGL
ncbi:hypothetical protein [Mesorhizobium sp. PUT5]|uniref:hypothetical protein n=1 Tax=Mesorhizobium sp. PUT5 TaxID=3454629 RepID=UPI003FA4249A